MRTVILASLATICLAGQAFAAAVTINNHSFEAAGLGAGGWSDAAPAGWVDPQGDDNTNFLENISGFASEGTTHIGFDPNEFGLIYQDLSTAWAPNTVYTLTVGVGNRSGFGAGVGRFSLVSSTEALPAPGVAGGPYSLFTPTTGFFTDRDTGTVATVANSFADTSFQWTTGAVAPAGNLRLVVQSNSSTRLHVDNFRLDATPVPEPAAAALSAVLAGVLLNRRRRA